MIINKNLKLKLFPYLLILPGVILLVLFITYPVILNLVNAFFEWNGSINSEKIFVGFDNFIQLLDNELFLIALKNTFLFGLLIVFGTVIIGFILASVINKKVKGWQFYRFAFFSTVAVSQVVVGILWYAIYGPVNGLLNKFLDLLNLSSLRQIWLGDPKIALVCIAVVVIWQFSGFTMIFFLAGFKNISPELYDSAKIDGADYFRYVLYIAIPVMKNIIAVVIMLMLISSFKTFDIIWVMTMGGPIDATQVLSSVIYIHLFIFRQVGPASAISVITLIFALMFSLVYLRLAYSSSKDGKN